MAKEYRATTMVIKDGKVLLVRDKGGHDYSMPGGAIENKKDNGITLAAGIREVFGHHPHYPHGV